MSPAQKCSTAEGQSYAFFSLFNELCRCVRDWSGVYWVSEAISLSSDARDRSKRLSQRNFQNAAFKDSSALPAHSLREVKDIYLWNVQWW